MAAGERVLLLGPSGAGKSTLLQGLAGLLDPDTGDEEGRLTLDGRDVRAARADGVEAGRARTGLLLQDPLSQTVLARCGDDVAFGLENHAVPAEEIWPRVDEALAAVGFPYDASPPHGPAVGRGAAAARPGRGAGPAPGAAAARRAHRHARPGRRRRAAPPPSRTCWRPDRCWLRPGRAPRRARGCPLVDRVVVLEPGWRRPRRRQPRRRCSAGTAPSSPPDGVWVPDHPPRTPAAATGCTGGPRLLRATTWRSARPGAAAPAAAGVDLSARRRHVHRRARPQRGRQVHAGTRAVGLAAATTRVAWSPGGPGATGPDRRPHRWRPAQLAARGSARSSRSRPTSSWPPRSPTSSPWPPPVTGIEPERAPAVTGGRAAPAAAAGHPGRRQPVHAVRRRAASAVGGHGSRHPARACWCWTSPRSGRTPAPGPSSSPCSTELRDARRRRSAPSRTTPTWSPPSPTTSCGCPPPVLRSAARGRHEHAHSTCCPALPGSTPRPRWPGPTPAPSSSWPPSSPFALVLTTDVVTAAVALLLVVAASRCAGSGRGPCGAAAWVLVVAAVPSGVFTALLGVDSGDVLLVARLVERHRGLRRGRRGHRPADPRHRAARASSCCRRPTPPTSPTPWHRTCGCPHRFVLSALAAMRLVGVLAEEWTALGQARRARGLGDGGVDRRRGFGTGGCSRCSCSRCDAPPCSPRPWRLGVSGSCGSAPGPARATSPPAT
jgi:hypothetical protein